MSYFDIVSCKSNNSAKLNAVGHGNSNLGHLPWSYYDRSCPHSQCQQQTTPPPNNDGRNEFSSAEFSRRLKRDNCVIAFPHRVPRPPSLFLPAGFTESLWQLPSDLQQLTCIKNRDSTSRWHQSQPSDFQSSESDAASGS